MILLNKYIYLIMCYRMVLIPLGVFLLSLSIFWPLILFFIEPDRSLISLISSFMISLVVGCVMALLSFLIYHMFN